MAAVVGTGDGGVAHGLLLARLVDAMFEREPDALAAVRDEVVERMGGAALVDAVAVSANFHMMTRIADGTGTPIDEGTAAMSEQIRAEIGVDGYVSRHGS